MWLPASNRLAWTYTILAWVFILTAFFGNGSVAALAWIAVGIMLGGAVVKTIQSWLATSK